jgi:hypothetical protein
MASRRELELAEDIQQLRRVVNDDGYRSEPNREGVVALPLWVTNSVQSLTLPSARRLAAMGGSNRLAPSGVLLGGLGEAVGETG